MPRAVWTPQAAQELDEILYFVAVRERRPQVGENIYFEIRQLADEYSLPGTARHTHPLAPTAWSYFLHKRWLIFFQPHVEGIEVLRIIDGTRDLPALLP